MARVGRTQIETWEELRLKLKEHFIPSDYLLTLYMKMIQLKQDNKSIDEYIEEFTQVTIHKNLSEAEAQKITRYCEDFDWRYRKR